MALNNGNGNPAIGSAATASGPIESQTSALTKDLVHSSVTITDDTAISAPRVTSPRLLYGCAWKKDRSADLVYRALRAGWRGLDMANQPRHYREDLVCDAVRRALADGTVPSRAHLFMQTKFTTPAGQDEATAPYDFAAPLAEQVRQSVESSLRHFAVTAPGGEGQEAEESYIDCLVLHAPLRRMDDTLVIWRAMEAWVPSRVRRLGISNTWFPGGAEQLETLLTSPDVRVRPSVVQDPFCPSTDYGARTRRLCAEARRRMLAGMDSPGEEAVVFQSIWTLTNSPVLVSGELAGRVAKAAGVCREAAVYGLVLGLGSTTVLDGTTSHIEQDMEQMEKFGRWAEGSGKQVFAAAMAEFKNLVG